MVIPIQLDMRVRIIASVSHVTVSFRSTRFFHNLCKRLPRLSRPAPTNRVFPAPSNGHIRAEVVTGVYLCPFQKQPPPSDSCVLSVFCRTATSYSL